MKVFFSFLLPALFFFTPVVSNAQTEFGKGAEEYKELYDNVKLMLLNAYEVDTVKLNGIDRNQFVRWIRDHVHVMKAMKYLVPDISSFWQFYMETQTDEGLYYDYYYSIENRLNYRLNLFDQRYWEIFPRDSIHMLRLPVEADLEYLMVEGAFYIWQATGDTNYVKKWLSGLEKGMYYAMTDTLRWSKKYQLVKRGYTLDTWDFMQLPTSREEYVKQGNNVDLGIFNIDEKTPMGIMHGDNSGMYAASNQLSQIFTSIGDETKANFWKDQAALFRTRTNSLCWNGKYYSHFVPDDPMPDYLHIDQKNTLSLSNPYDINRGLPAHEMAVSIINTYRDLKSKNDMDSFAEWFGIYPPVTPHFADYLPGSYMNGGVNTIVGGELAKAALQHGMEAYGVDILNRMHALTKKHSGNLPVSYKPDGTVDEGIPDNWGQAAVMSALIEGLAGVTDGGALFKTVNLSPRWIAAGKNDVEITVAYGPSGKFVTYRLRHSPKQRSITIDVSGDPHSYNIRMLLPTGKIYAKAILDKKVVKARVEKIETSIYVVIPPVPAGQHTVVVTYR